MNCSAVCFDVGNTLLRPFPGVAHVCHQVLKGMGHSCDFVDIEAMMPMVDAHYEDAYSRDDTFWADESATVEIWTGMYAMLGRRLGIGVDADVFAQKVFDEFGKGNRWEPFEDVLPALERLASRGVRMAVISNWDSRLEGLLQTMGLTRYFETVISSASVGLCKPDPRIFELACDRLGVASGEVVHVGDHHYADVVGASAAGLCPVLIDRTGAYRTQRRIATLDSLEAHLGWSV